MGQKFPSLSPPPPSLSLISFEGIGILDGSAEKEKDFWGTFQKQVQFNPGQSRATWRIKILSDGKYEQSEIFNIILSEPVMGALESPAVATVEIIDPEDGKEHRENLMNSLRPWNVKILYDNSLILSYQGITF